MASNNLFGTLQTPLKPIHYTGIDTKTIDVIVESENRTIRANIQPEVLNVISGNVSALKSAYEKLTALSKEIDQVENVITNIYNELNQNLHNLKADTKSLTEEVVRIQDEYATEVDVKKWIDEARIPQAELNTYAKAEDVANEVARLDSELLNRVLDSDFEIFATDMGSRITDVNTKIDILEASIGPLPSDKTLKEEIYDTFATQEALEVVQNQAGRNSVLLRDVDSELFDIKKSLEDDYATKQYVSEEISKIDIPVGPDGEVDLSNYYTKSETENKIEDALNDIAFISAPSFENI